MSDRNFKEIRKQLRTVVRELLPEVLKSEVVTASMADIKTQTDERLNRIADHIQSTLESMDKRQSDIQSYILRNTTHVPVAPSENSPATPDQA